ncbi:MAG TPA: 30S ribosomal protein S4 [archaeon]|nr:30S ribosomal protein S4 [archaeon]
MGHPRKQRRKYETPFKPYDKERIGKEKKIMQEFGLRRKKEIWRAESILRNFRSRARDLQASRNEMLEKELIEKLKSIGINVSAVESVLDIRLENFLSRRLQTIVCKRGMASTPKHARQLITHGHVYIDDRRIVWPSYIVGKTEDDKISIKGITKTVVK